MADKKLTELTALTGANLADADLFVLVDVSDTTMAATGTDKKITRAELQIGLGGGGVVATDAIFDAKGDLPVGTGANTAAKLTVGAFGAVAKADSTTSSGLIYGAPESLREKYLKPTGSYENFSRTQNLANQAVLTSGTVALTAIALPKNFLVTSISFCSATTAAVTPTNWWFSLCDNAYTTLRSTANQTTTAWAANTVKTVNLASTFTTTYEGLHYLAIMMTATTVPSIQGAVITPTGSAIAPFLAVVGLAAQTTPPADGTNLATSPTGKSTNPWAYVT